MQVDGECSNHRDMESEESPIGMQVGTGDESSSSDTESEEEILIVKVYAKGIKTKIMQKKDRTVVNRRLLINHHQGL